MAQNKRETGSVHEKRVAAFLEKNGFQILAMNYRCRTGEIDIVARDKEYLVFVEVKYRSTDRTGYALEAIDKRKAIQVRRTAAVYLYEHHYPEDTPCRFDAAGVDGGRITYIENAF